MKQDKAEKIIKKAEQKAQKAAAQVQVASKKAEAAAKKQAAQAERKANRIAKKAEKKAAKKSKQAEQATRKAQMAAQKAAEKKAKAVAKVAAKAGGEEGGEDGKKGGKGKKKGKKKLLLIVAVLVLAAAGAGAFFFLKGGDKEEEEAPPEPIAAPAEYLLNGAHISALPVWGEGVLVYQEEVIPEPPEEEPAKEEDQAKDGQSESQEGEEPQEEAGKEEETPEEEIVPLVLYRYEGLQSPKDLISAYTALMTTADAGFSTVDEELLRIDTPEFSDRGSVQLARNVPAEGETEACVHSLLLSWDATSCTVTLDTPDGRVHDPKPEKTPTAPSRGLSDLEALHPSKLGLPGESMEAYELMPQEGSVLIAGNPSPCMRVNIYGEDGQIAGSYFLSGDGHLYKLDETRNAVVELEGE